MQASARFLFATSAARRARVVVAVTLLAVCAAVGGAACGSTTTEDTQGCLPTQADGTCLSADDAKGSLPNLEDCAGVGMVTSGPTKGASSEPSPCCYTYTLTGCTTN